MDFGDLLHFAAFDHSCAVFLSLARRRVWHLHKHDNDDCQMLQLEAWHCSVFGAKTR